LSENIRLNMHGEEFEATPDNTSLYTFIGDLASRNHVFIETATSDKPNTTIGTYVFSVHPTYQPLMKHLIENDYPVHMNLRAVAECDENAYQKLIDQAIASEEDFETLPDGW